MQLAKERQMRIAQVAPLHESVPPKAYGGTERVVHALTEELLALGHQVTLFASGDSVTSAELVAPCRRSLRLAPQCHDSLAWHQLELALLAKQHTRFDLVHFHLDYLPFVLSRALNLPQLTTLHGRLDLPDLAPLYGEFSDMPLVSISDEQRRPLPLANWIATVYHGLDIGPNRFNPAPEDYLAFVGRISPEKGVDRAVDIAKAVGSKLKVAAKIDAADREYFEREIAHLFNQPLVEYLGELDEASKLELMAKSRALLMPIDWPEPFGLVAIEAMACGTPVLAFRRGSMPEVIDEGVTGLLFEDVKGAIAGIDRISTLSRHQVRRRFDQRFGARRMAQDYLRAYENVLAMHSRRHRGDGPRAARTTSV
jgi:glycosyltransferase involved in cell wall biosynthesis